MTIRDDIAQLIDKKLDGDCGYGVGESFADALMPLVKQAQAEALREAATELEGDTARLDAGDPIQLSYINCTLIDARELRNRADRIEKGGQTDD